MIEVDSNEIQSPVILSNSYIEAEFSEKGKFSKLFRKDKSLEQEFNETYSYYTTDEKPTRSGHYLFNPRHEKVFLDLKHIKIYNYDLPEIASIIQIELSDKELNVLKTHILFQDGDENFQKQLFTQVQVTSDKKMELYYSVEKLPSSPESEFKAFIDDSMKLVERPIYDRNIDLKRVNDTEINGYFTVSSVHGGIIKEEAEQESYFGWANTNTIGCTLSGNGTLDIMVSRSSIANDKKGINEDLTERNTIVNDFQMYIGDNANEIMDLKLSANARLNEPLSIFPHQPASKTIENMHYSSSLLEYTMNSSEEDTLQLSKVYGEVDVVDVKVAKHNVLKDLNSYEVDIVLRNRFDCYVDVEKTLSGEDFIFKNHYIDYFKDENDKKYEFKINPDKKILEKEREELNIFEEQIINYPEAEQEQPVENFKGLEPYEMAQFKIVSKDAFDILESQHRKSYPSFYDSN